MPVKVSSMYSVMADDSESAKSPCNSVGTRWVSDSCEKPAARCSSAPRSTAEMWKSSCFSCSATYTDMA